MQQYDGSATANPAKVTWRCDDARVTVRDGTFHIDFTKKVGGQWT